MVKKAEGTDRAFFWGTDFSTQGYMKWTLAAPANEIGPLVVAVLLVVW